MKMLLPISMLIVGCGPLQKRNSASPMKKQGQQQSAEQTPDSSKPSAEGRTLPQKVNSRPIKEVKPAGNGDPNFLKGLPKWEDINPPENMPRPTAGLGLVLETNTCFKEFFGDRTVHPHVRKHGGRILSPDEKPMGRMIICPEERKVRVLMELKKAGVL